MCTWPGQKWRHAVSAPPDQTDDVIALVQMHLDAVSAPPDQTDYVIALVQMHLDVIWRHKAGQKWVMTSDTTQFTQFCPITRRHHDAWC